MDCFATEVVLLLNKVGNKVFSHRESEVVLFLNKVGNKVFLHRESGYKPYFQPYLTTKQPQ